MNTPIVSQWGKDHWSLLAYLEDLCVKSKTVIDGLGNVGTIDKSRLRANEHTHPLQAVNSGRVSAWNPAWGTRLKGYFELSNRTDVCAAEAAGVQLPQHDDWDCLDDLEVAGLVTIVSLANGFVALTSAGLAMGAELRAHKAKGAHFATFVPACLAEAA
jgi:hypothetical protein